MTKKIGDGDPTLAMYIRAQKYCLDKAESVVKHIREDGLTPVRTGKLIEGYEAVEYGDGAAVMTDVEYWKFVEFGTTNMDGQPHVTPAYEEVRLEGRK